MEDFRHRSSLGLDLCSAHDHLHLVVLMFILSKLFKWDLCIVSTASLANIGGSASAPIVATAYNPNFAGIGVLMGVLSAAIGNFCGLAMGAILQLFV